MENEGSNQDDSFVVFVADQLAGAPITIKRMFGGYGMYWDDAFFGIISDGRLYFKTSESTRTPYLEARMTPFQPTPKQTLKNYYEVPPEVVEDAAALLGWADEARQA